MAARTSSRSPRRGCTVVWLEDVKYFLEDMKLVRPFRDLRFRSRPDYAKALPWLIQIAEAKSNGMFGGFDSFTTGTEDTRFLPQSDVRPAAESSPTLGYLHPPALAVLRSSAELMLLRRLRFHCGGRISVFEMDVPPPRLTDFCLDGSLGWSNCCQHSEPCSCRRSPVSPWAAWGQLAWETYNAQLEPQWQLKSLDGSDVSVHHVTVVVFHTCETGFQVLRLWRSCGSHFTNWAVPGGNVERGKDEDIWASAAREWEEEMLGYPWRTVVGEMEGDERVETIAGCHVYRRGHALLCIDTLDEVTLVEKKTGGQMWAHGPSCRSTATLFVPSSDHFFTDTWGKALSFQLPHQSVTKDMLRTHGHKIHTDGWLFVEHVGEAWWTPWKGYGNGLDIFPSRKSGEAVVRVLEEEWGWW